MMGMNDVNRMKDEVHGLRYQVENLRQELSRSQNEIGELRRIVEGLKGEMGNMVDDVLVVGGEIVVRKNNGSTVSHRID